MTDEQRQAAINVYKKTILNCQKMQPKFEPGTPQATLLLNRIAALRVAIALVAETQPQPDRQQLAAAVAPIHSIIHKTTVAQQKYEADSRTFKRLAQMITAMQIAETCIQQALGD